MKFVCRLFEVLHGGGGETFCRIIKSSAAADILSRRSRTTGFRSCDRGHARAVTKNYILAVFDKNPSVAPPADMGPPAAVCVQMRIPRALFVVIRYYRVVL